MNPEDITLNHIKILKTVDDCGSFSKAAQKLECSQALISKKVRQIEECFGVKLLNRSPGAIGLTYKGRELIAQTHSVVETVERLQGEFQITLSTEGEDLFLGVSQLSELWLEQNLHQFNLCFPGRDIKRILVKNGKFFSELHALKFDALINSLPAYKEKHHCTRLQTQHLLLIAFNSNSEPNRFATAGNPLQLQDIDFTDVVLLDEIHQELLKHSSLDQYRLAQAVVLENYQQVLEYAAENQKLTILPEFCLPTLSSQYSVTAQLIQGNDYGIYIHVPPFGELLISAESLVRSFNLNQYNLEQSSYIHYSYNRSILKESAVIRVGIQRDSLGQLIAAYGTKYISEQMKVSASEQFAIKDVVIDRNFSLQIIPYSSGEQINRQMKRGELDICILDDISLLNNGSCFFDDLTFGSKLIAIASYNLLGQDSSIILPQHSSIKSIDALKGKRIATLFGSNAHRYIVTLFESYGISISKDCELIDEDPRTAATNLLNGTIDAYVCCNTFAEIFTEYVSADVLVEDRTLSTKVPSLRGIVCRSQFLKENPKFVIAYLHDLVVANYWFSSNPERAIATLSSLIGINQKQINSFFNAKMGTRVDPTLKPQWSWLLKTLNRRLNGRYNISLFDVDFWIEDYFLRLVYNLLELDYHLQQISFSNELSNSYFMEEKFSKYANLCNSFDPACRV
jgi:molybdate transport repressor ModE-like protein